ncbi:BAG family molecular chaperone regulator 4 [Camellia lanceoleosa]|uniref:BAG family molecular chaperone regulator 4 n=1 Tax=Camellia lanceoleosa TaxID=1840588 RepID=A0ACC0F5F2_9ERIC|nr:BAG family molecular chaperone regulator 4 [Camellia lanceoleosa]
MIVPTEYRYLSKEVLPTNQFSVTEYYSPMTEYDRTWPAVYFLYDLSPSEPSERNVAVFSTSSLGFVQYWAVANLKGTSKERKVEEVKSDMLSRACAAIAEVRAESYEWWDQGWRERFCHFELLMRQLLKLDGIEAEGEGKVQQKLEVSVQDP